MEFSVHEHATALGTICSHWTIDGLYRVDLDVPDDKIPGVDDAPARLATMIRKFDRQLVEFCLHGETTFTGIRIDASGWTDFTKRIYECCRKIRPGKTMTYKQLAQKAGNVKASRAVGAAMARNRILLVIPCHRVIASNGQLRGFSAPGGLTTKQRLLDLERRDVPAPAPASTATLFPM